jgi:hypothetical protein
VSKKLGLTPLEVAVMNLAMGGGRKNYGEIGYMASSMFRWTIPEEVYRPRFLKLCAKGIVSIGSWADLRSGLKMRPVAITRLGAEVIAGIGKMETEGRDEEAWRWHSMFDPFENYAQNPHKLDNFMTGRIQMKGRTDEEQAELNDRIHWQLAQEALGQRGGSDLIFD